MALATLLHVIFSYTTIQTIYAQNGTIANETDTKFTIQHKVSGCIGDTLNITCPIGYLVNITSFLCDDGVNPDCFGKVDHNETYCSNGNCSQKCTANNNGFANQLNCKNKLCTNCHKICSGKVVNRTASIFRNFKSKCFDTQPCLYKISCDKAYIDSVLNSISSNSYPTNNFNSITFSNYNYCEATFYCVHKTTTASIETTTYRYDATTTFGNDVRMAANFSDSGYVIANAMLFAWPIDELSIMHVFLIVAAVVSN